MDYYIFKFNLEPSILSAYNYDTQRSHVMERVIPIVLKPFSKRIVKLVRGKLNFRII